MNRIVRCMDATKTLLWPPQRAPLNCLTSLARNRQFKHSHRDFVAGLLARFYRRSNDLADYTAEQNTLEDTGLLRLDGLVTEDQAHAMRQWATENRFFDPYQSENNSETYTYPPPTDFTGSHGYVCGNLLRDCPGLLECLNDTRLLGSIEAYFGCKPTLANVLLQWTFQQHQVAQRDQLYHRDLDDWRFVKLFVYLGDVLEMNDGPHIFVARSHHDSHFLRTDGTFETRSVEEHYSRESLLPIYGKAGTSFVANTFGVHRGVPPQSRDRLVLTAVFSLNPYSYFFRYPAPTPKSQLPTQAYDPYVFRMFASN